MRPKFVMLLCAALCIPIVNPLHAAVSDPLFCAASRPRAVCMWIGAPRGVTHDTLEADLFPSNINIQPDRRVCTSGHSV